jgi:hypothetical protein
MTATKRSKLAILYAATSLCGAISAFAQNANLPFKPGLWVVQVSLNKAEPKASRTCFLAGTNLDNYLTLTNQGIGTTVCTVSNKAQKGRGITFDNACTQGKLASTGHFDFQSPDELNFTGTSHIVITGTGTDNKPVNKTVDREFSAKYVSNECAGVAPLNLMVGKPNTAPAKSK